MIDGLELLQSVTTPKKNNSLVSSTEDASDLDRLLQSVLAIEDFVIDKPASSSQAKATTEVISTSPTVSQIIGYKGDLNAIVPAGFILLHNDLTNAMKKAATTEDDKDEKIGISSLFEGFPLSLVNLFTGDAAGKSLSLSSLFNGTGIANLAKMAGWGIGLAGFIDNLTNSFDEEGNFNLGRFVEKNAIALTFGIIAGVYGGPALGAAVYGAVSLLMNQQPDLTGWNTVQTALNDPDSEEAKKYGPLLEKFQEKDKLESAWVGQEWDQEDAYGEQTWVKANQFIQYADEYIAAGQKAEADYLNYFTEAWNPASGTPPPTPWAEILPEYGSEGFKTFLQETIMAVGTASGDTQLRDYVATGKGGDIDANAGLDKGRDVTTLAGQKYYSDKLTNMILGYDSAEEFIANLYEMSGNYETEEQRFFYNIARTLEENLSQMGNPDLDLSEGLEYIDPREVAEAANNTTAAVDKTTAAVDELQGIVNDIYALLNKEKDPQKKNEIARQGLEEILAYQAIQNRKSQDPFHINLTPSLKSGY